MKRLQKKVAACLCMLLLFSAFAPQLLAADASEKEEVVYLMTDASGVTESINVVNIFSGGSITDYGDYTEVKMLTTDDPITQEGDKITFTTEASKVYYQGTLETAENPWNISIRYYLNGEELTPSALAGKSGRLRIAFQITENPACPGSFYEHYALQATFLFDTELCHDLTAPDATFANVGKDKQLTYTILPGKGIDTEITAEVVDFAMDAVSVNGVALNLNIEIDDSELMEKVNELISATAELNNGAYQLSDGTQELKSGSEILRDGSQDLYIGAENLDNGIATLREGILTVQTGLDTLNGKSKQLTSGSAEVLSALRQIQSALSAVSADTSALNQLTTASGQIQTGINKLDSAAAELVENVSYAKFKAAVAAQGVSIDTIKSSNTQAAAAMTAAAQKLNNITVPTIDASGISKVMDLMQLLSQNAVFAEVTAPIMDEVNDFMAQLEAMKPLLSELETLKSYSSSLQQVSQLLNGNNSLISGMETYLNTVNAGIVQLKEGTATLKSSYEEFNKGISTLTNTVYGMLTKLNELKTGINTLTAQYGTLNTGIGSYTDGVAQIVAGYSRLTAGVSALASGTKELLNGADSLSDGASDLFDGVSSLCDGASELANGTEEFQSETSGMDTQVTEKVDEILSSIGGDDFIPESFVSEKNTNVTSVQFVIKTAAIEPSAEDTADEPETETLTFWQKLLRLFGWY